MKIVHINASDRQGGAALAAWRLHHALRERGIDSQLLVLRKSSDDASVTDLDGPISDEAALSRQAGVIEHVYRDRNRTDISNTHFSLSLQGVDLSQHPLVRDADLIHLHWIASFQTPATLRSLAGLGKPVVWTLHDLEPFTGGCHFPAGCDEFKRSCSPCRQLRSDPFGVTSAVLRDKEQLWSAHDLMLVAPSRWIAARALESTVFRAAPRLCVIPNGVDPRVFRPHLQAEARSALGLPREGKYLLSGADHAGEKRKGFAELRRALGECLDDPQFKSSLRGVLWLGEEPAGWSGGDVPFMPLGRKATAEAMAIAYSAADVFVLPSLEDNLPNMLLESLSCGTPVAAFAIGGVPEVVSDGVHGRVVDAADVHAMARALRSMLANRDELAAMGTACRALVEDRYSCLAAAERHVELYRAALEAPAAEKRAGTSGSATMAASGDSPAKGDPGSEMNAILPNLALHCWREELHCRQEEVQSLRRRLQASEDDRRAQLKLIECVEKAATDRLDLLLAATARLDLAHEERRALERRLQRTRWIERLIAITRRRSHVQPPTS